MDDGILIDTNVVSEAMKPSPAPQVVAWLNKATPSAYISALTIFELRTGIAMLRQGKRREALSDAVELLARRFDSRILSVDLNTAHAAAGLFRRARDQGHGLHQIPSKLADLLIGGTAIANDLKLATRNHADFANLDIMLINPWAHLY